MGDWGRFLIKGKQESFISVFKKGKEEEPGNDRLVSLTLVSGKVVEQLILETTSKENEWQENDQE